MAMEHKRLGDLLLAERLITEDQLDEAVAEQRRSGQLLGATLIRMGVVSETVLLHYLQRQLGLAVLDLNDVVIDESVLALVKEDIARKYTAMPVEIQGRSTLVVAMADPLNVAALEDLRFHAGMFIKPVLARTSEILESIERFYHIDNSVNEVIQNIISSDNDFAIAPINEDEQVQAIDDLIKEAEGRPIVRLTNWILHRAVEDRASDVHIEPQDRELVVRLRIDGMLQEIQRLPKWTQGAIVSRIKVLSNLDIAEKRQPQDGRLVVEIDGRRVDMRVSTLPVTNGEKVVVRVVDTKRNSVGIAELGMSDETLGRMRRLLERPQGILLVTGPTGSGKTTLLYSALNHVRHESKNIVTVEDPVEYQIPGINQVQVDEKGRKTFPAALRAILRQDPDIIMIGEIRDKETAQIAFRASVTGHLVLTTVHTNDAASAITRLIDLGLEPFMVASSLMGVISMRLVRMLCPRCKEAYEASASNLNRVGGGSPDGNTITLHRGRGCSHCHETGYIGRTGVFELLEVDENIRGLIARNATDATIRHAAVEVGMRSVGEDGLRKVMAGITTLEEVSRVVYLEEQTAKVCPGCQAVLTQEFEYCPNCGDFVGEHCEHCRRRMQPEWTFCPSCGENSKEDATHARNGSKPQAPGDGARGRVGSVIGRRKAS